MNKKIKLIIIDLYGVMTRGNYWNVSRYLAKKYKLKAEDIYQVIYYDYFNQACLGIISEKESFKKTIKKLQLKENPDRLRKKHMSFQKINKSVFKFVFSLSKDYKILLLSKNVPSQFNEIVKKYKLDNYFDILNTFSLKLDKKDPKVIKEVLRRYKLKPQEVIMVDDQEFNLVEPKKLGVKTILYKNFVDFKIRLNKLLK